ncbi:hypothetical protein [Spiroplasma sp. AdecLV25b]|uniref:hypothetical protein n=1 Tax=Spiroplasma sp. AdecLV25b TaxID=3027162 RepID=UPI0027DF2000|nr:hypothetical protein [Spiroplasma sp. AdecLV25b]
MRKILSLIGILAMSSTTVLPVVACKTKDNGKPSDNNIVVNDQVKKWAQESSVVTKSLLTSKQQNINTNNLLNDTLKNSDNNIKHDTSETTDGNSYQDFTNDWGYNKTITGNVGDKNFVDNSATTAADNFNSIKDTIKTVKSFLPIIKDAKPEDIVSLLNLRKSAIEPMLLQLFNGSLDIPSLLSSVGDLLDSLKGFDQTKDLTANGKNYYNDGQGDIAKSIQLTVLGPNGNDGWLTASGYDKQSEATSENVTTNLFTKENISKITSWDSFFMAKTSIDINNLYKTTSNQFLGKALNEALVYNERNELVDIDTNKLLKVVLPFIANPMKLIEILIPVIKWQVLGFPPTTTIKTIIDGTTASEPDKGILNINDVLTTVKNLITSPENFATFFTNLLSANDKNQGIFSDVVINASKDKDPTTFTQTMESSKLFHDAINNKLKDAFNMLSPSLAQYNINDWLEAIIKTFTSDDKLNINFIDFSKKIKDLSVNKGFKDAIDLIKSSNKDNIDNNWNEILSDLGVKDKTFTTDSPLGMILDFLKTYDSTIDTILTNVTLTIDTYIPYVYSRAEKTIDFNKDTKLWTTTVDHGTYDEQTNQSTIFYTLTKGTTTYNIVVVIAGDASQKIGDNKSQIWIKDITLKS